MNLERPMIPYRGVRPEDYQVQPDWSQWRWWHWPWAAVVIVVVGVAMAGLFAAAVLFVAGDSVITWLRNLLRRKL